MSIEIEPDASIFIDANIFLYAISGHWRFGKSSKELLKSVDGGEYKGLTSVLVCSEIFHRVLMAEIVEAKNIDPGSAVRFLKENPGIIRESHKAWDVLGKVRQIKHLSMAGLYQDTLEHWNLL